MKTTTKNTGIKVNTGVKAGGLQSNHARSRLRIKSGVRAAGLQSNHTRSGLKVRTDIKAGGSLHQNHNAIVRG
jgi:hypothetical protein